MISSFRAQGCHGFDHTAALGADRIFFSATPGLVWGFSSVTPGPVPGVFSSTTSRSVLGFFLL